MTRDQAKREFEKLLGHKRVRLEAYESVSSPERRERDRIEYERVKAEMEAIDKEVERIIAEHQELQALYKRRRELRPERERLNWGRFYYKFELLAMEYAGSIGWTVWAKADTWAEAIDKVRQKKAEKN